MATRGGLLCGSRLDSLWLVDVPHHRRWPWNRCLRRVESTQASCRGGLTGIASVAETTSPGLSHQASSSQPWLAGRYSACRVGSAHPRCGSPSRSAAAVRTSVESSRTNSTPTRSSSPASARQSRAWVVGWPAAAADTAPHPVVSSSSSAMARTSAAVRSPKSVKLPRSVTSTLSGQFNKGAAQREARITVVSCARDVGDGLSRLIGSHAHIHRNALFLDRLNRQSINRSELVAPAD